MRDSSERSYAFLEPLPTQGFRTALALSWNQRLCLALLLGGTAVLTALKLLLTAAAALLLDLVRWNQPWACGGSAVEKA